MNRSSDEWGCQPAASHAEDDGHDHIRQKAPPRDEFGDGDRPDERVEHERRHEQVVGC